MVMTLYVSNNDGIKRFVEQISNYKDMQSSLKLTQNIDVAGRYGATKSINSKDLTREQVDKNCENA